MVAIEGKEDEATYRMNTSLSRVIIGPGSGLSPVRLQAITWTYCYLGP